MTRQPATRQGSLFHGHPYPHPDPSKPDMADPQIKKAQTFCAIKAYSLTSIDLSPVRNDEQLCFFEHRYNGAFARFTLMESVLVILTLR